jgi:hypothetical protein
VRQSAIFTLCGEAVILFLVIGRRGGRLAGEAMRYFHYWLAILLMGVALPTAIAKEADASGAIISAAQPIDVFYFSDRQPVAGENGAIQYGADRAWSLAFGSVAVFPQSGAEPSPGSPKEIVRFPETPYKVEKVKGGIRREPPIDRRRRTSSGRFRRKSRRHRARKSCSMSMGSITASTMP